MNTEELHRLSSSSSDSASSVDLNDDFPVFSDDDDPMPFSIEEDQPICPDDHENELVDDNGDFPLFPQEEKLLFKTVFLQEVWAMITSFKIMHKTSDVAVLSLCKMLNALLSPASPKRLPDSVKLLKKKMYGDCLAPRTWIVFCTMCKRELLKSVEKPTAASCTACRY